MAEEKISRGEAITNVVKSDSVVSLSKEYIELGIDTMLESGALKDIPLVSTIVGIFNGFGTVKDHIFATKLIKFLSQLSDIPQYERMIMVDKLNRDEHFAGKLGTVIIEILERMESEQKPEIAAKCFSAYTSERISFTQLRHMLHALERVPTFEISGILAFSKADIVTAIKMEESTLLAYVNAGLGKNNGGFDGGAVLPTDLCRLFVSSGVLSLSGSDYRNISKKRLKSDC